jgi:hypothetical protein
MRFEEMTHRRRVLGHPFNLLVLLGVVLGITSTARAQRIPERLADSTFWRMVNEISEPGGYFHSDNFVSNEAAFQYVIPPLLAKTKPGGVYVGVGPDQNFTYLVAFRPKIAFIVDIRRQNLIQHLMYKALIEQSANRAEFLSRLFSRPRPARADTSSSPLALFEAFTKIAADTQAFVQNLAAMKRLLVEEHGFTLSTEDLASLDYVYGAFYAAGPDLTYSFGPGSRSYGGYGMPTFAALMVETDAAGVHRSYLASETNYRILKDLETRNLIVPVVGDFGGPKALRTVGEWIRERDAKVNFFYVSNVEQYLFQQSDAWSRFYTTVSTFPLDSSSAFIRSVSNRSWVAAQNPRSRSAQLVSSIADAVVAFKEGRLQTYFDVVSMSK